MANNSAERLEVTRNIAAEPADIFALLTSPDGHVRIDASGMLMSATGEQATAVGSRFDIAMDRDALRDFDLGEYSVTVVITAYEADRHIEWTIEGAIKPPVGHVFGYRLTSIEGGTAATSYCDWTNARQDFKDMGIFPVISETNLLATLGILARTVAPGKPRPGA